LLLYLLESVLLLLELEEAFSFGVKDVNLLLHLAVGLHEAIENGHEVIVEDRLLVADHL